VRAARVLKPFRNRRPFVVVAEKPSLLPHGTKSPRKSESYLDGRGKGGIRFIHP
jgi:hypothetical protein